MVESPSFVQQVPGASEEPPGSQVHPVWHGPKQSQSPEFNFTQ